jgi:hypothetical protein
LKWCGWLLTYDCIKDENQSLWFLVALLRAKTE